MKLNRFSITRIFRILQITVTIAMLVMLATNIVMEVSFNRSISQTILKNDALGNIYDYNTNITDCVYQYLLSGKSDRLDEYSRLKSDCLSDLDRLVEGVSLHRTHVMFHGLRNMYNNAFSCGESVIAAKQQGDSALAVELYKELKHSVSLINDVFNPMVTLYEDDLNSYLRTTANGALNQTRIAVIIQISVIIFSSVLMYYEISQHEKKIARLTEYAGCISRQEYEQSIEPVPDSENELDILGSAMSEMAEGIQKNVALIEEKDRLALEKSRIENEYLQLYCTSRDSELKALNSQINPHFLYNTLGIVSQLCCIEGAEKASRMLDSVIDAFQYITHASNSITDLNSELEFLSNYFYICSIRYENKITFTIKVQENIPNIKLPGMILQPIVENSILHGVGVCAEGGVVSANFSFNNEFILIEIEDNGIGMNYDISEELIINEYNDDSHIGVSNVLRRLRLYFGSRADVIISSEPGCGTVVTVAIPIS